MEHEQIQNIEQESTFQKLNKVTPFSKYFAMVLFIIMPFIGAYVGYRYAPEKVAEPVKIAGVDRSIEEEDVIQTNEESGVNVFNVPTKIFRDDTLGVSFEYPSDWLVFSKDLNPERKVHQATYEFGKFEHGENTLIVHEDALDPTAVMIQTYDFGLDEALERWSNQETKFETIKLAGVSVVKITTTVNANNNCTSIRYIHDISSQRVGEVTVRSLCPSHPEGYDALKIKVAESVRFDVEAN